MENFLPNWALLKHPGNWLFVAFCLITLLAILYFVVPDLNKETA